ncbi:group II intron maturase-specific domain-containing protein [Cupriavidus necator]|uniref:group II intron maturase-specific domain-containing protein n=1 Tax=Cupriavidus necator TaxID=106590 RepID=UPI0039C13E0E
MRQTVRGWRIHSRAPASLDDLARFCNRTIQGRWNYYGAFYRTAMLGLFVYLDQRLEQWARRKYRRPSRRKWRSMLWLRRMKKIAPRMFVHWEDR